MKDVRIPGLVYRFRVWVAYLILPKGLPRIALSTKASEAARDAAPQARRDRIAAGFPTVMDEVITKVIGQYGGLISGLEL